MAGQPGIADTDIQPQPGLSPETDTQGLPGLAPEPDTEYSPADWRQAEEESWQESNTTTSSYYDTDGDGYQETVYYDTDGDGITNTTGIDTDGDGFTDYMF